MKTTTVSCTLIAMVLAGHAWADDTPAPKGNFMSTLKQGFQQNYDREVVRGHFDIGTAPEAHRYYCLIDPKTGKVEANGVAGTPTKRRDGMTGIQSAAVSFYSCTDAESKGLLVTGDYQITLAPGAHTKPAAVAPVAAPPASPAVAPAVAASVPAAAATVAPAGAGPEESATGPSTADPMSTLVSFIGVYNSGDGASLAGLLGESSDFAWVQPDGRLLWGHRAAAEALQAARSAGAQLLLEAQEGHPTSPAPRTVILITKLRLTQSSGAPRTIHCSSVMVQTAKGWRIASLFMTPGAT